MVVRRPLTHSEAHFGEDGVDRQGVEARHLGQIHAGDPGQRSAEITRWLVSVRVSMGCRRWREGLGITINQGRQGAEDACDFLIAGRQVLLGTIRECQGWGKRADMFRSLIALERFDNGVQTGGDARVSGRRSGPQVARSSNDRTEHAQAGHACHVTDHVVPGQMHVVQRLVPVLPMFARHLDQMVAMAEETAELAEGLRRTKRRRQPPIPRQLLEPATITAIRCRTPRDIFDMAGIDERDLKAAGLEAVQQRHPVHPGGCHHDGGNTTGCSPVGAPMHVTGTRAQCLDRLGIAIRGHTDPVFLSPHSNAGGMWVDEGHSLEWGCGLLAFFRHTFLQSGGEREAQGKTGLLLRKDTRGGGERRYCFILIEPAQSVGGTLTTVTPVAPRPWGRARGRR
jgi:hypothetical protein